MAPFSFFTTQGKSLLFLVVGVCLAVVQPCLAKSNITLPPPMDKAFDIILGIPPNLAPGNSLTNPPIPQIKKSLPRTPQNIMPIFLGIPYRQDGIVNDNGQYATFNAPDNIFNSPGLNCSGLVLAASRIILQKNLKVVDCIRDREGDSGPDAEEGHDWDFGFDLVMNISEGWPRRILSPQGTGVSEKITGKTVPTFDLHGSAFAEELLSQILEKELYLISFSRHTTPDSPPKLHYHTGILVREGTNVWLYSTTTRSGKAIRHNLATEKGLARFQNSFGNAKKSYKRLTVVQVTLNENS